MIQQIKQTYSNTMQKATDFLDNHATPAKVAGVITAGIGLLVQSVFGIGCSGVTVKTYTPSDYTPREIEAPTNYNSALSEVLAQNRSFQIPTAEDAIAPPKETRPQEGIESQLSSGDGPGPITENNYLGHIFSKADTSITASFSSSGNYAARNGIQDVEIHNGESTLIARINTDAFPQDAQVMIVYDRHLEEKSKVALLPLDSTVQFTADLDTFLGDYTVSVVCPDLHQTEDGTLVGKIEYLASVKTEGCNNPAQKSSGSKEDLKNDSVSRTAGPSLVDQIAFPITIGPVRGLSDELRFDPTMFDQDNQSEQSAIKSSEGGCGTSGSKAGKGSAFQCHSQ